MLAQSLRQIAEGGREAFYRGEIAQRIAQASSEGGGFLSSDDLATHEGTWLEPVSSSYRGYDVWELPPNGQGIAALLRRDDASGHVLGAQVPPRRARPEFSSFFCR